MYLITQVEFQYDNPSKVERLNSLEVGKADGGASSHQDAPIDGNYTCSVSQYFYLKATEVLSVSQVLVGVSGVSVQATSYAGVDRDPREL